MPPWYMDDQIAPVRSSAARIAQSATGAHRRPRANAHTTPTTAIEATAKITSRPGRAPMTSGKTRNTTSPAPIQRIASPKPGRWSRSHWIPTAPSAGTIRNAR